MTARSAPSISSSTAGQSTTAHRLSRHQSEFVHKIMRLCNHLNVDVFSRKVFFDWTMTGRWIGRRSDASADHKAPLEAASHAKRAQLHGRTRHGGPAPNRAGVDSYTSNEEKEHFQTAKHPRASQNGAAPARKNRNQNGTGPAEPAKIADADTEYPTLTAVSTQCKSSGSTFEYKCKFKCDSKPLVTRIFIIITFIISYNYIE